MAAPPALCPPGSPPAGPGGCGLWTVTSGAEYCVQRGACITDGEGDYGNNERCTITANVNLYASVTYYQVEV